RGEQHRASVRAAVLLIKRRNQALIKELGEQNRLSCGIVCHAKAFCVVEVFVCTCVSTTTEAFAPLLLTFAPEYTGLCGMVSLEGRSSSANRDPLTPLRARITTLRLPAECIQDMARCENIDQGVAPLKPHLTGDAKVKRLLEHIGTPHCPL